MKVIALVIIDQGLKAFILAHSPTSTSIHQGILWDNTAGLAALGKIAISLCLIGLLVYLLNKHKLASGPLQLILAGGISNTLDWPLRGGILNIFNLGALSLNPADIYIIIGVVWILAIIYAPKAWR